MTDNEPLTNNQHANSQHDDEYGSDLKSEESEGEVVESNKELDKNIESPKYIQDSLLISNKKSQIEAKNTSITQSEMTSPKTNPLSNRGYLVNLENFDPFDTSIKINSPRSLDICLSNGIDPHSLYHKSYDAIKESVTPLRRNDCEYIKLKYIENESKRSDLLNQLKKIREHVIKETMRPQSIAQYPKRRVSIRELANHSLGLVKGNLKNLGALDPDIIKEEEARAVASNTKELKNIVGMIKKECNFEMTQKYRKGSEFMTKRLCTDKNLPPNSLRKRAKTSKLRYQMIIEEINRTREQNLFKKINKGDLVTEKWKKTQYKIKKNLKMISDFERERSNDRRELVKRKEGYKQMKLLERIHMKDERSMEIQKIRAGVGRLRQEMRKNAFYNKYRAKLSLEGLTKRLYASQDMNENMLIDRMLDVAGIKEPWKIIDKIKKKNS